MSIMLVEEWGKGGLESLKFVDTVGMTFVSEIVCKFRATSIFVLRCNVELEESCFENINSASLEPEIF